MSRLSLSNQAFSGGHTCIHTHTHVCTWKAMRPGRKTFSPVSGWKAESYRCFAAHTCSSVVPAGSVPALR